MCAVDSQTMRLLTFRDAPFTPPPPLTAMALVGAGLSYRGPEADHVRCGWCELELKGFDPSHCPLAWHRTYSRNCPFLRNNKTVETRDLGIEYPEISSTVVELDQVLPRLRPQETTSSEGELDMDHGPREPGGDGHLTIQNTGDIVDGNGSSTIPTPEEYSRIYNRNRRLKRLIAKSQVEHIKNPLKESQSVSNIYLFERNRRATFVGWPNPDVSIKLLAASGFIFSGVREARDVVECIFCKIRIGSWTAEMVPNVVHQKKSPSCRFIQGLDVKNIPDVVTETFDDGPSANLPASEAQISVELGIITDSTKIPEFAVQSRRDDTFLTWPATNQKLASEMKEHHVFYTGTGDTVCCFSCGTEMSGWTDIEDVWTRHARQALDCQLLIREKGQDFVTAVIEQHGRFQEPPKEPAVNVVTTRMLRPRMDSQVAQGVLLVDERKYKREDVRNSLIYNIKYGGPDFKSRADLVRAILKRKENKQELDRTRLAIELEPSPPVVVTPPALNTISVTDEEPIEELEVDAAPSDPLPTREAPGGTEGGETSSMDTEPAANREREPTPPPVSNPNELARTMKAQLTCKICMDAPVGIAFLPCGHMVCCPSCAPAMLQCPLCRQDVKGTVRAHLDKL